MKNIYIDAVLEKIEKVRKDENIEKAAEMIAEAIKRGNLVYSFGASHAGILSEEMFYRAGGLALINPIFDKNLMLDVKPITKTSELETLSGYGKIIARNVEFKEGDVVIAHSVSGRNPVMVDFAMEAKEKGVRIIGITNLTYSKSAPSRHESGKRLFDLSDIVIDNHGDIGDAAVKFENIEQKVGATSTVVGAVIVNSILVAIVEILKNSDILVPIFYSANIDGTKEHNDKIFEQYKNQIKYQG